MQLEIKGLNKTYPNGIEALKDVSLIIPTGMFGLVGPNGAGKSTLMRTIATLQEADKGEIRLNGMNVLKDKQGVRKVLGYLPQEFGLYPRVNAETFLNHIARLKGIASYKERKKAVEALLHKTNLYQHKSKKLGGFSGGMKQRFGIAQALLGNPQLIIVDEPTAGLDPSERNRFHNLLSEIGENIVVILSTHIIEDVKSLCNKMAIIHNGKILLTKKPEEAIDELKGHIWRALIKKEDFNAYNGKYNIISSRLLRGKTEITVYGEQQPGEEFKNTTPTLDDVYFSTISKN